MVAAVHQDDVGVSDLRCRPPVKTELVRGRRPVR